MSEWFRRDTDFTLQTSRHTWHCVLLYNIHIHIQSDLFSVNAQVTPSVHAYICRCLLFLHIYPPADTSFTFHIQSTSPCSKTIMLRYTSSKGMWIQVPCNSTAGRLAAQQTTVDLLCEPNRNNFQRHSTEEDTLAQPRGVISHHSI